MAGKKGLGMDAMGAEPEGHVIGYMCATDWDCEIGLNASGNVIFPSLESAKEHLRCNDSCGIVEVHVTYSKTVQEPKDYDLEELNDQ